MSTMLLRGDHVVDDDEVSGCTFHSARASSFNSSAANSVEYVVVSIQKSGNDDDSDDCSSMQVDMWNQDGSSRLLMQRYLRNKMLRKLRQDKNGDTYLAELNDKKRTRTLYAIKTMRKGMFMTIARRTLSSIETEREVLKCLSHPFLPTVHADIDSEDFFFLVMDFCPGGDLRALLRRGPLSEGAARFYAVEVLLAMHYLHTYGIIYNSLKLENVLIKADGHIMLSGFDHARFLSQLHGHGAGQRDEGSNETNDVRIPPEVAKGEEHGIPADLYTFGIFLYELLFGTTPSTQEKTTCMGRRQPALKFPQEPVVSCAARDLLKRLLNKNPKRRLGHKHGINDVKQHAFFRGINFAFLQSIADGCLRPPQLPNKFYKKKHTLLHANL